MGDAGMAVVVFWAALGFLLFTYLGYPGLLWCRSKWKTRPIQRDNTSSTSVSFLIIAHNEEKVIRRKLENTLNLDYPSQRREVLVASDGSTDGTNDIVREFQDRGVSLLAFPTRRGKAQVINDAIPLCEGEIIVMSDARQLYAQDAVVELVSKFQDPTIGAVTGDLQFQTHSDCQVGEQIGLYWKYEKWIRRLQSQVDSTTVVTGAIYAFRKALFRPLPERGIADDLAMPMSIVMQNYRVVFEPAAKAYDRAARTFSEEFSRRVRTIAGSYQYFLQVPAVFNPKANRIFLDFLCHKLFRVLAPFSLVALLVANLAITAWPYRFALGLQVAFYVPAGVGAICAIRGGGPKALSAAYTFLMLNAAAPVALFKLLTGTQTHLWDKAEAIKKT